MEADERPRPKCTAREARLARPALARLVESGDYHLQQLLLGLADTLTGFTWYHHEQPPERRPFTSGCGLRGRRFAVEIFSSKPSLSPLARAHNDPCLCREGT